MKGVNKLILNNVTVCLALTEYLERRRHSSAEKQEATSVYQMADGNFQVYVREKVNK